MLAKFDKDGDGLIDDNEAKVVLSASLSCMRLPPVSCPRPVTSYQMLVHEIDLSQTNARYAAYTAAFARGFRSD